MPFIVEKCESMAWTMESLLKLGRFNNPVILRIYLREHTISTLRYAIHLPSHFRQHYSHRGHSLENKCGNYWTKKRKGYSSATAFKDPSL